MTVDELRRRWELVRETGETGGAAAEVLVVGLALATLLLMAGEMVRSLIG